MISKNVGYSSTQTEMSSKCAIVIFYIFYLFSKTLTTVLIAHVKMAVPVQIVSTVTRVTASQDSLEIIVKLVRRLVLLL